MEEEYKETDENIQENSTANYIQPNVDLSKLDVWKIAQSWSGFYELLKELTRSSINDFWFKVSILLTLYQNSEQTQWTPQEIVQEFNWLQDNIRKRLIAQLSKSNWLEFVEGTYRLSSFGRSILSTLSALIHQENVSDALGANISSLTLLEMYENDPTNTLRMFLNELIRVDNDIVSTMESKSEYLVRKLNKRIRSQFSIAIKSREHLEHLPNNNFNAYRLKQEIHEKLSGFHSRLSEVQKAQNALVARHIILADQTLTQHDINTFLINASIADLAKIGHNAISIPITVSDMIPQLMMSETELQLTKERVPKGRRSWSEPEMAVESEENFLQQSRFLQFVGEVEEALKKKSFALEKFVPKTDWNTSSFRFCMLSVLESGEPENTTPEQAKLCPKLKVEYPKKEPFVEVINDKNSSVQEITKAIVSYADVEEKSL